MGAIWEARLRWQRQEFLRDANRKAMADLLAALESVEWVTNDAGLELCPCCDGMKDQGHGEFCEVGNALARARGES